MAIEFTFKNGIVCVRWYDTIVPEDVRQVREHFAAMESKVQVSPNWFSDFSDIKHANIGFQSISFLTGNTVAIPLKNKIRSALVAISPTQLGYARMYQSLERNDSITVKIFEDRESAWSWLTEK